MWIIIIVGIVIAICFKVRNVYKYWEDKGVPYIKPLPIFGNVAENVFRKRAFPYLSQDFYNAYPDKRYVGIYQLLQPLFIVRDPELIKKITVKEFDTFPNHSVLAVDSENDIGSKSLFNLMITNGWHEMRATLSPSFTSSKMRSMFVLMEECADRFTAYFEKQGKTVTISVKDVFTRYTSDVIGTTAFGVTCDSLENPENEFYLMGKKLTDFSGFRSLIFFGFNVAPKLMKLFNIHFFKDEVVNFFRELIRETLKVRRTKQIVRPDMIHLLMEAQAHRSDETHANVADSGFAAVEESEIGRTQKLRKEITDEDITAQAVAFFFAGFDTSSNLLCYAAYELAMNPDVQEKLSEEIYAATANSNGKITYEILLGMKYLDGIVTETLRKWPPAVITDRKSVKPITIEPERPEEKPVQLDTDTMCWIPVYAIHRDPQYYPEPDQFKPERFSEENKHSIKPFTYLPFGAGPRNCIGSRFALLEGKLLLAKIVQKFEIVPVAKTPISIEFSPKGSNLFPEGGILLGLKPRSYTS